MRDILPDVYVDRWFKVTGSSIFSNPFLTCYISYFIMSSSVKYSRKKLSEMLFCVRFLKDKVLKCGFLLYQDECQMKSFNYLASDFPAHPY